MTFWSEQHSPLGGGKCNILKCKKCNKKYFLAKIFFAVVFHMFWIIEKREKNFRFSGTLTSLLSLIIIRPITKKSYDRGHFMPPTNYNSNYASCHRLSFFARTSCTWYRIHRAGWLLRMTYQELAWTWSLCLFVWALRQYFYAADWRTSRY